LKLGEQIYEALQQIPEELYSLAEQQLILETVILGNAQVEIDMKALKDAVTQGKYTTKEDKDFDRIEAELLKKYSVTLKPSESLDEDKKETTNATS